MSGICAVIAEDGKAFLSVASLKKSHLNFLEEKEIKLLSGRKNFLENLKANSASIEQQIVGLESKHSLNIDKVFVGIPSSLTQEKEVTEKIVLPKKRKVSSSVIDSAKEYIENKFLEWNEYCIHHIILNYQVENLNSSQAPIGFFTNKIKLNSLLIYIKDDIYKEVSDLFYNTDRNFAGFVAHKLGLFFQGFDQPEKKNQIVISVGNSKSYAEIKDKSGKITEKEFNFSIKEIIKELSKQYTIAPSLAKQLLERYGTFKMIPYFKEISIKKGENYLRLSTQALSNFLKHRFSENIKLILDIALKQIKNNNNDIVLSFIGPLTLKEGFYGYIKNILPYQIKPPLRKCKFSSFGCIKYGAFKPLESDYKKKLTLVEKIKKVYHEYF